MFKVSVDKFGTEFFSLELEGTNYRNASWKLSNDIGPLLNPSINITKRATGPFSGDLTSRDDVLLAFMSLMLLLLIEGLVTTVLLRTKQGNVSNFGFSVKQIVALIQELNFRGIFKRRKTEKKVRRKINAKLLLFAISIISVTFLLEVGVLFLTTPDLRNVTNKTATFRLLQPVTEDWHDVRYHIGRSIDRPCESFGIQGVEQGATRINGCVSSSISGATLELFSKAEDDVEAEITSLLHDYGAEHFVKIHGEAANYSTRAYFTLSDGETRVMRTGPKSPHEEELILIVHKQYVAFLLSLYKSSTEDKSVSIDTLNALTFDTKKKEGDMVDVLPLPGQKLRVKSTSYTTKLNGFLPYGIPALRLAQHCFRGAAAVSVEEADIIDLTIEDGMRPGEAVVWQESVRAINWLSLIIILMSSMLLLGFLRYMMKPVATAEIAGIFVKNAVGGDASSSPVELGESEKKIFHISSSDEDEYLYGAETSEGWVMMNSEYNDPGV